MTKPSDIKTPTDHDRLIIRPDAKPLPSAIDPANPHEPDFPDPKPVAKEGQGDPDARDPAPTDIERSV